MVAVYVRMVMFQTRVSFEQLDIKLDHKRIIASDGRVFDGVYHIQHVNGFIGL